MDRSWVYVTVGAIDFFAKRRCNTELLLLMVASASFVGNDIAPGAKDVATWSRKLNVSEYSLKRYIRVLVKEGCLYEKRKGWYVINPYVCFRGSSAIAAKIATQFPFERFDVL